MDIEPLNPFPRRGLQQIWKLCGVLLVVVGFTACSSDVADADGDAGLSDADAVSADTEADAPDTRDAENGDPTEDNGDGGTDPNDNDGEEEWTTPDWEECDCEHPEDECHRVTCGRPGVECGPGGEECPEGYSCTSTGGPPETWFCKCDGDRTECGPYCEEKAPDACPGTRVCDLNDGVCRSGGGCSSQAHCPEGQACINPDVPPLIPGWCYETGDLEEGESCDEDIECQTGICHYSDGVCVQRCFNDGDCEDDEVCRSTGCSGSGDCSVDCPEHKRCSNDLCRNPYCHNSGDCEDADCVWQGQDQPLQCEEHPDEDHDYVCKPEEYLTSSGDTCILPGTCWSDDTCGGDPYECVNNTCERDIGDGGPS